MPLLCHGLSAAALQKLDSLLAAAARNHKKLILRFLYDWDGKPEKTEPADLKIVKTHIAQTSAIVNQHTSTVFLVQGCFVGAYGEMHSGAFCDIPTIKDLIWKMHQSLASSIFLAVCTPAMQRFCTENALSVTRKNAFYGTLMSRLGLFNDGMLGSETDLGTYSVIQSDGDITQKGTRAQELAFEDQLSTYIPSGFGLCTLRIRSPSQNVNAYRFFSIHLRRRYAATNPARAPSTSPIPYQISL